MSTTSSPASTLGDDESSREEADLQQQVLTLESKVVGLQRSLDQANQSYNSMMNLKGRKIQELETKVKGLLTTIMMCDPSGELKGTRMSKKKLNEHCGKDMAHRLKDFTYFTKEEVWRKYKVLPPDWHMWKEDERKLCQVLMKKVTLVRGEVRPVFWKSVGVKVANTCLAAERSYCVKRLRIVAEGMCIVM